EKNLFKGFFSVKRTKANFERDYNLHISNITKSFPTANIAYEYIQSPYHKDGEYFENEVDILSDIRSDINTNGPKLILIEAPAGFGKTCTAYEIGRILSEQDDEHLVLFAELSRDRHAKIFNHVLQRELARSFPAVPPMLVNKEIKNGKITVILDGFDELLNEREDEKFQFEKSQAMLETIGKMLENNAKIILTTRKTAILQGD
ncbi:TPA: NACHT domain-containing protein, partial [Klebsiella pneumoniae subsp. pneumoniae]|nr:NACHT domain-containing protein [Klebsiella pneumoniae subsp. pneumoniae]